jgi:mono/diheme cytochrome c family protein
MILAEDSDCVILPSRCRKDSRKLIGEGDIMRALVLLGLLLLPSFALADEPSLSITIGNQTRSFTRAELLARPDAKTIEVASDVGYRAPMTYRAVPVAALLAGMTPPPDSVIEAVALNGFIAQIPPELLLNTDASKAVAWLAIEPQDQPWPPLPGQDGSAGPFSIVWTGAQVASIRSEQWPYQLAKLASQPSPAARWPGLNVDSALPPTDPARAGQALFIVQCLTCHKLNGDGAADVGPDLNLPQNPTEYLSPKGLHDLIRNPKAVRTWPAQIMPPLGNYMSDDEIDLVIAYLKYMAGKKRPQ